MFFSTDINVIFPARGVFAGSNKIKTQDYDPDLSKTIKSLPILAELFTVADTLTLSGGESLLYWDEKIVPLTIEIRKHFPTEHITVFSNGLLVNRFKDKVYDYIRTFAPVRFTITEHLKGLGSHPLKKQWDLKIQDFTSEPFVERIHDKHFHIGHYNDHVISFYSVDQWKNSFKVQEDGKIKPYATQDPTGSMMTGCTGNVCSTVIEDRLYKCSNLASLKDHLHACGQADDPDWKKYLEYPYIDLINIDQSKMQHFVDTHGKPIDHCDMCPNSIKDNLPWDQRDASWVLP